MGRDSTSSRCPPREQMCLTVHSPSLLPHQGIQDPDLCRASQRAPRSEPLWAISARIDCRCLASRRAAVSSPRSAFARAKTKGSLGGFVMDANLAGGLSRARIQGHQKAVSRIRPTSWAMTRPGTAEAHPEATTARDAAAVPVPGLPTSDHARRALLAGRRLCRQGTAVLRVSVGP